MEEGRGDEAKAEAMEGEACNLACNCFKIRNGLWFSLHVPLLAKPLSMSSSSSCNSLSSSSISSWESLAIIVRDDATGDGDGDGEEDGEGEGDGDGDGDVEGGWRGSVLPSSGFRGTWFLFRLRLMTVLPLSLLDKE